MVRSPDRLAEFVERILASLAEARSAGASPPVERRRLSTVARDCGARASATFLARLNDQVDAAGLHVEPPLDSAGLRRDDWIRFSTEPFPPDELLFPRERDLQRFVEACIGTGIFRELKVYQEGRRAVGREFRLADGQRIDLLCEQRTKAGLGDLVAIELKREHQKGTVEQMMGYIDALRAKFNSRRVRGMIITGHEERLSGPTLDGARAAGYAIDWYCYSVEFRPVHPASAKVTVSPKT